MCATGLAPTTAAGAILLLAAKSQVPLSASQLGRQTGVPGAGGVHDCSPADFDIPQAAVVKAHT